MSTLTAGAGAPPAEEAAGAEAAAGALPVGAAEADAAAGARAADAEAEAAPPLAAGFVWASAATEYTASGRTRHTRLRTIVTRRRISVPLLFERGLPA
jgi:hypothetical protein